MSGHLRKSYLPGCTQKLPVCSEIDVQPASARSTHPIPAMTEKRICETRLNSSRDRSGQYLRNCAHPMAGAGCNARIEFLEHVPFLRNRNVALDSLFGAYS